MSQLSLIRQGGLAADIEQALSECVRQVCYLGKGGSVTIKISVKPATKNSNSNVIIGDEITLKTPKPQTAETILFSTDDGMLCDSDPRQRKLDFGKVEVVDDSPRETERFQKVN
jgi:hypothetical protein